MSELSRQLPPLATLVVFEAAFRLESFSRAADECALSQASVSRQMRLLEENLGASLFERQRYNVLPTEAGVQFYAVVRRALLDLASTAAALRDTESGLGKFTIYSDLSVATSILAPLIGHFQQTFPRESLINSLVPQQAYNRLAQGDDPKARAGCP